MKRIGELKIYTGPMPKSPDDEPEGDHVYTIVQYDKLQSVAKVKKEA